MDKQKQMKLKRREEKAVRQSYAKESAFVDLLNQEMRELQDSMKQKQIQEIRNVVSVNCGECHTCKHQGAINCVDFLVAEELYNAGYRKIPENAVVLTKEELEDMKFTQKYCDLYKENKWLHKSLSFIRKGTAEKYHAEMNKAIESVPNATKEFVQAWKSKNDEICKEITEGKG